MTKKIVLSLLAALLLFSCASNKKIPYFKGITEQDSLMGTSTLYEARIVTGDMLTIVVSEWNRWQ